jgi:hypothetical protein
VDSDDSVAITGYSASSGNMDNSIETLLDIVCKIAGTKATFPGDTITPTHTFADGGELTL